MSAYIDLHLWLAFVATEIVLCLTPGPAVLLVVSQGMTRGRVTALWAATGILGANTAYFLLSATGLGAVLLASHTLFMVIKWAGATYLIVLGLRHLLAAGHAAATASGTPLRARRAMVHGLTLKGADPKTLLYFVALLPQFIHEGLPVWPQVAVLAVTSVLIEFVVLTGYAAASAGLARTGAADRARAWLDRAGGLLLIGAGVATARRAVS